MMMKTLRRQPLKKAAATLLGRLLAADTAAAPLRWTPALCCR